jgi:hypothetical protein
MINGDKLLPIPKPKIKEFRKLTKSGDPESMKYDKSAIKQYYEDSDCRRFVEVRQGDNTVHWYKVIK